MLNPSSGGGVVGGVFSSLSLPRGNNTGRVDGFQADSHHVAASKFMPSLLDFKPPKYSCM